jgi:hypothetical protein
MAMNHIKYQIPGTELYLRSDGIFSPIVEPGEKVLELTRDHIDVLNKVYFGQALKNMNVLDNSNSGANDSDGSEAILTAVDFISLGFDFLDFVKKLNDWVTGADDPVDPVMENLRRIHETLSQIQDFSLGAWFSAREDNLAFLLAHSSTAIQTANAFLQSNASRTDPVWAAKIAIADRDSLIAVNTFSDIEHGYWLRPQSIKAISQSGNPADYYHGWMPHIPDRAEVSQFQQVWDYRWAQPALTYTILARLIVLKAFSTDTAAERKLYCQDVKRYVKMLGLVFSKRWAGLRTLDKLSDLQRNTYLLTGRIPMAAVDIYDGDYLGGIFFASNFIPTFFNFGLAAPDMDTYSHPTRPLDLVWVDFNVRAFARHWWNLLYLRTGLEKLFLLISELDVLCDGPWFSRAYADLNKKIYQVSKNEETRKTATVAVAISDMLKSDGEAEKAIRTQSLFQALNKNPQHAQAMIEEFVKEISTTGAY